MATANATNRILLVLTLLFALIAVLSFAAFRGTKGLCDDGAKCSQSVPVKKGGLLWDDFSRRFVSSVVR